jgi:GT2 family glycosyltransferase
MTFSAIIINYKTPELTIACLKSLFTLPRPEEREIIVIDNHSEDGSVEMLRGEFGDKIQIIVNKKNLGFAGANNQGAALATGDYLLFLNSDTIATEDFLSECLSLFKQNEKIGIISPRLKLENNEYQKNAFGRFPTFWRLITQVTKKEQKIPTEAEILKTDWVSGCALMIRRELFKKVGGWDDHFFLYFEDVDICKRVKEERYETVVNLKTNITHLGGKSLSLNSERKKYYYEAQDYYFGKWYGLITKVIIKVLRYSIKTLKGLKI